MVYLESIMLVALGFVLASLIALFLLRLVWHHGERVGRRRVQQQFPTTSEELRADRARLRAENAMLVRRHEMRIQDYKLLLHERHRDHAEARAQMEALSQELRQREDQIAKLRAGRNPLEEELAERTTALQALQRSAREYLDQIQRLSRELESAHMAIRARESQIDQLEQTMASAAASSSAASMVGSASVLPFAGKANGSGDAHADVEATESKSDVVPAILTLREETQAPNPASTAEDLQTMGNGSDSKEEGGRSSESRKRAGTNVQETAKIKETAPRQEPASGRSDAAASELNGQAAPAETGLDKAAEPGRTETTEGRGPLGKLRAARKRRSGRQSIPVAQDAVAKVVQ